MTPFNIVLRTGNARRLSLGSVFSRWVNLTSSPVAAENRKVGTGLWPEFPKRTAFSAALLSVMLSHKVFTRNGKSNPVHLFDCGNAFENLALQGTAMGLVVHGMQGFDFDRARTSLGVPDDYAVAAMFAVGRPGDPTDLPEELRQREKPSGRKAVSEIICEGSFAF